MKHAFAALVALALFSVAMVGCGDDDTPTTQVNTYFKFNNGDKFTYDYYGRTDANARDESSKEVRTWTVVRTDLTMFNRDVVTEVQQIRFEADGTTAIDTTMLYFIANGQGQVLQYNLLQTIIGQFSSPTLDLTPVIEQVPDTWIQVSDTKSPSPLTWSFPELLQNLQDVNVGGFTLDAKLTAKVNSSHQGKMSETVTAGTYADAFVTDHTVPITIVTDEAIAAPPIPKGTKIIDESMMLHYTVSVTGGILKMSMDSKNATIIPLTLPYPVKGFEMELKSVTRATAN